MVDPEFDRHSERVCQAIGIGVVAHDLGDVEHIDVRASCVTEDLHVALLHPLRSTGQLICKSQNGQPAIVDPGRFVIRLDPVCQFVIPQQPAQTAPVVRQSVVAFVYFAYHHRDHFSINLRQ